MYELAVSISLPIPSLPSVTHIHLISKGYYTPSSTMSLCIQQNRPLIIACAGILGVILYLNWSSELRKQHDNYTQQRLSQTLEILRDMEARAIEFYARNDRGAVEPGVKRDKEEFSVADRGFWQGLGATKGHMFDVPLATALVEFMKKEKVNTLLELGCGTGAYAKMIKEAGVLISCYDGNPETQELSEGRCAIVDLSKPIDFCQFDWTLSLEVGEHIPKEFEDIFINNILGSKYGIILSWAVEGQGGTSHVNTRNNSYIRDKIVQKGYNSDFEAEKTLRAASTFDWFKNTLMVFRKQI